MGAKGKVRKDIELIGAGTRLSVSPLWQGLDMERLPRPCLVIHLGLLQNNLSIVREITDWTQSKWLFALKAFAMWSLFDRMAPYFVGVTASSLNEALLGREEFPGEVHLCAPAYPPKEMPTLLRLADAIVFHSWSQWQCWQSQTKQPVGLRINPQHSETTIPLYDPCQNPSRLGVPASALTKRTLKGITGLHFHTLCEKGTDALARTLEVVERDFGQMLYDMEWVNFGGGHLVTSPQYDKEQLCEHIRSFQKKYNVSVYLEPGAATVWQTGVLVSTVLDIHTDSSPYPVAILDVSFTAHMPDVLEMPYLPQIFEANPGNTGPYSYMLGGLTCLAGDQIGPYSWNHPLQTGDILVFCDMAHYTTVKSTMFNGVNLPSLATWDPEKKEQEVIAQFGYDDYKNRLS